MEHLVATGGADRKVNLWDVGKGKINTNYQARSQFSLEFDF